MSCASYHQSQLAFINGKEVPPEGAGIGSRNVPSLVLAAHNRWQLWDAHAIERYHRSRYEALFGPLPALSDTTRFAAACKPGDAAYEAMAEADREAVTLVFVHIGKSIAAFERSLRAAGRWLLDFDAAEVPKLLAFLETLTLCSCADDGPLKLPRLLCNQASRGMCRSPARSSKAAVFLQR